MAALWNFDEKCWKCNATANYAWVGKKKGGKKKERWMEWRGLRSFHRQTNLGGKRIIQSDSKSGDFSPRITCQMLPKNWLRERERDGKK